MTSFFRCVGALALFLPLPLWAAPGDIYACVDARGNQLTSDRYIAACADREQRLLSRTGTLRQIVPPSYTGQQRAEIEAKKKAEEEARAQEQLRARAANALLQRYPNAAALLQARNQAAAEILPRIDTSYRQLGELREERRKLDEEMAFYQKNPKNAPGALQAKIQLNDSAQQSTEKYIAVQRDELVSMHKRLDADQATLVPMWNK